MITFYVPTLNSEKTIKNCLESILAITKNIVMVDSGSTDGTINIAKKYSIKLLKSKNLANGRNVALNDCRTKYIAYIDSDVIIKKDWLEKIMPFAKKDVAGINGRLVEKYQEYLPDSWRAFHLSQDWGDKAISPEFLFGSNVLFQKDALEKAGGFDEKYGTNYEDVDISLRLKSANYKLAHCPDALCYHLKKDNALSVLRMARKWSFHSYNLPESFLSLIMRLFIYNPHYFLHALKKDIFSFKFQNIPITLMIPLSFAYHDLAYFFELR